MPFDANRISRLAIFWTCTAIVTAVLLGSTPALAHVGSPDVYAEGYAGPYRLLVTVRPPLVIPGVAEIEVRIEGAGSSDTGHAGIESPAISEIEMAPIPLTATGGGSGNPVTYSVSSGPGTIACTPGCALTITGLGTVTVDANQAGNANYLAAPQVVASVVVSNYLAPVISGLGASSVSTTSETLSATINPENAATSYFFTYGPSTPSTATAPKVLAAGVTGDAVSATLAGLQPNTTYYYKLTAKSLGGQVVTSTLSFTTP